MPSSSSAAYAARRDEQKHHDDDDQADHLLLSAWRKMNDRQRSEYSLRRHRRQPLPSLSPDEAAAVERRVVLPTPKRGTATPDVTRLSVTRQQLLTPSLAPSDDVDAFTPSMTSSRRGRSPQPTTASKANRVRNTLYTALVDSRRQREEEAAAIDRAVRKKRQLYIAAAPKRLAALIAKNAQVTSTQEAREIGFDQTTSVEHHDEHTDKLTPRHVKANYIKSLAEVDEAQIVPPTWKPPASALRSPSKTRRVSPSSSPTASERRGLSPGSVSPSSIVARADRLQQKAIARLSRSGLPPAQRFDAVSEAISAVVASTVAARLRPEPRGLCGDSMTYWDRLNFYGRFAESCGNDEETMRSAVMRSTHR